MGIRKRVVALAVAGAAAILFGGSLATHQIVRAAAPVVTTTLAPTSVLFGTTATDTITVTGGTPNNPAAPTNTVTLTQFNNGTCSGAGFLVFTSAVFSFNAAGNAGPFSPVVPGAIFIPAGTTAVSFVANFVPGAGSADTTTASACEVLPIVSQATVAGPGPTVAAVGCANTIASNTSNNLDIAFSTFAAGGANAGMVSNPNQLTAGIPDAGTVPANMSYAAPAQVDVCGAVFQDAPAAVVGSGSDANPNTVDGGTITYTLLNPGPAQILESNSTTFTVNCGSSTPPSAGSLGGLESCQGAVAGAAAGTVSPSVGNLIHVGLRVGSTFGLVGTATPTVTLTATYNRFPALGPATLSATATTNIIFVAPIYAVLMYANPGTIPAGLPTSTNTQGSVITAALYHVNSGTACLPTVPGTAFGTTLYTCNPSAAALAAVSAGAGAYSLIPGAESGTVTFSTNLGVFSAAGPTPAGPVLTAVTGAAQVVSVHCGTVPNTFPTSLIPTSGLFNTLTLNSCQSVSATLVGGGEAGTATVVANFVGDFTGAQPAAQGEVTVNLTPGPITVALTTGCNEVLTPANLAGGSTGQQVAALASGFNVSSVWVFNNALHVFQALYFPGNAPTDISSVGPNQSVFVCGTGAGTFRVA